jgi:hypothetical protein
MPVEAAGVLPDLYTEGSIHRAMARLHLKLVLIIVVAAFLLYMAWHTMDSGNAGVAILNALVAVALIILAVVNRDNL